MFALDQNNFLDLAEHLHAWGTNRPVLQQTPQLRCGPFEGVAGGQVVAEGRSMPPPLPAMVDSGGGGESELSSGCSGGGQPAATAYRTFRSLVESADRKFARVRDSPAYAKEGNPYYRRKVFKAYTRVWRFQQEHRREMVEAGLRRWEIGDVASRIGQLYYAQYLRTSDVRFLVEAYVFYEAILSRGYFERGKEGREAARGKQQLLSDLGVRCKELRFYARFVLVALLLNRRELVWTLVERFRALVDHCRVTFPVSLLCFTIPVTAASPCNCVAFQSNLRCPICKIVKLSYC